MLVGVCFGVLLYLVASLFAVCCLLLRCFGFAWINVVGFVWFVCVLLAWVVFHVYVCSI